jgi:RNA polymerase sigma factor (sigma-70 family)
MAAGTGDTESFFRDAYDRHAGRLFNTAFRILGNRADAEDALQEAFLAAFRHREAFEGRAAVGTWLHSIVVNRSINLLRARRSILTDMDAAADMHTQEDPADDEDLTLDVDSVKRAVASLPDGYRTVICLHLFEGYDHGEISGILGVAPASVRSQYHRARKQLATLLKEKTVR